MPIFEGGGARMGGGKEGSGNGNDNDKPLKLRSYIN